MLLQIIVEFTPCHPAQWTTVPHSRLRRRLRPRPGTAAHMSAGLAGSNILKNMSLLFELESMEKEENVSLLEELKELSMSREGEIVPTTLEKTKIAISQTNMQKRDTLALLEKMEADDLAQLNDVKDIGTTRVRELLLELSNIETAIE